MTQPPLLERATTRVSDMVRGLIAKKRLPTVAAEEQALAPHLRGNQALYDALVALVRTRIDARLSVAEPTDPLVAKSMIARDRELQWLLGRLESVYRSPVNPQQSDEPPAA